MIKKQLPSCCEDGTFIRLSDMVFRQTGYNYICNKCGQLHYLYLSPEDEIESNTPKKKKLLFVEDGSVDIEELREILGDLNTSIVVYRKGAEKPFILEVE